MNTPTSDTPFSVRLSKAHLLIAYFSGTFSFSYAVMITFIVSLRARELGASLPQVGILVGAASLVAAFSSIPAGALTQRIGAHRVYYLGTLICVGFTALLGFTTAYWAILVLQVILGSARTASWVASQTYITGVGSPEERVVITGRFSFATNVGTMIFPLIMGFSADMMGFQNSIFLIAGISAIYTLAGLSLPAVFIKQPDHEPNNSAALGFGAAFNQLRIRGIQVAVSFTFVRVWYQTAWMTFFPVFLVDQGVSPTIAGSVLASTSFVAMFAALAVGRIQHLASKQSLTAVTLGLGALGVGISPHMVTIPFVYLPALLYGLGVGVSLPLLLAMFSEAAPAGGRGVAMGVRTSSNQVAALIAPTASGFVIGGIGVSLGLLASSGFAWLLLVVGFTLHRIEARRSKSSSGSGGDVGQD